MQPQPFHPIADDQEQAFARPGDHTTPLSPVERRLHPRYTMPAMYVPITVHRISSMAIQCLDGHVYDISRGGIRFELDVPLEIGETVRFMVELPCSGGNVAGLARVVRLHDELDDPGPRRIAVQILTFDDRDHMMRLQEHCESRPVSAAA